MRAIITIGFQSDSNLKTPEEIKALFQEQWEQTPAAMEGDSIDIITIEIID